jgi:hypothetical protein
MVTLKCLIGVSGQIQVRSVPDLIGRSGQSGQVNLTCRPGPGIQSSQPNYVRSPAPPLSPLAHLDAPGAIATAMVIAFAWFCMVYGFR